jgi:hypothetical protein
MYSYKWASRYRTTEGFEQKASNLIGLGNGVIRTVVNVDLGRYTGLVYAMESLLEAQHLQLCRFGEPTPGAVAWREFGTHFAGRRMGQPKGRPTGKRALTEVKSFKMCLLLFAVKPYYNYST